MIENPTKSINSVSQIIQRAFLVALLSEGFACSDAVWADAIRGEDASYGGRRKLSSFLCGFHFVLLVLFAFNHWLIVPV